MNTTTRPERSLLDEYLLTHANGRQVEMLFNSTNLRRTTVHPTPDYVAVTVASLEDLAGWLEELGGDVVYADVPGGFRSAVLSTWTPVCGGPGCRCRSAEVRVAVVYAAGTEDENWHEHAAPVEAVAA